MNCNTEKQVVFCCLCCRKIQRLCKARAEAKFTWIMPSRRQTSVENERLCKARAEAKFTWIMPSRRQTSVKTNEIARHITAKDYEHARIDRRGY